MKIEIEFPDNLEAWKTHKPTGEYRKVKRNEWYLDVTTGEAKQWIGSFESISRYIILAPPAVEYRSLGWVNKYPDELGGTCLTKEEAVRGSGRECLATVEVFEEEVEE